MATAPYLLQLPTPDQMPGRTLRDGVSAMAINAESTADARAFAKAQVDDDCDVMWDAANATAVAAATTMADWKFRVKIVNPANAESNPGATVFDETVTADGTLETEVAAIAATAVLTNDAGGDASDTQTVTIGSKTYTLQGTLTNTDGHVKIGASVTATLANLMHAVNASGGTAGVDYAALMTANADVVATASDATTLSLSAKVAGVAGNSLVSTETLSHYTFGGLTFANGADAVTSTDKVSSLAEMMVAALNASALIAGAAFNNSTHVLTVAETTDSLGDHRVFGYFISPSADPDVLIGVPGFITDQADAGSAGDAITLTLVADSYTVPTVVALLGPAVV